MTSLLARARISSIPVGQPIRTTGSPVTLASLRSSISKSVHIPNDYSGTHRRGLKAQDCLRWSDNLWRFRRTAFQSQGQGHRRELRHSQRLWRVELGSSRALCGRTGQVGIYFESWLIPHSEAQRDRVVSYFFLLPPTLLPLIPFTFGDVYQLCPDGHQMGWNLADLVVPL